MKNMTVLLTMVLLCITAVSATAAATVTVSAAASATNQIHEFNLEKSKLDHDTKGTPLLEGNLVYQSSPPEKITNLPTGLSNVAFTSIPLFPKSFLIGIRGADRNGSVLYIFDQNHDNDFSDEMPVLFTSEGDIRTARIPIRYSINLNKEKTIKETELSLYERSPGRIEYHFNELWEATIIIGGETLNVALQRWAILFIDNNFSGSYDKFFSTEHEILALGGKFFRVRADFQAEKLILEETDRTPVDQGFPAPDFDVPLWQSEQTLNLADQKGKLTILTFWSPLCSGSRDQAALYSRLAEEYRSDSAVTFLAVTNDEAALKDYLKDNPHHFQHTISPELWDLYGVTAPFVTFLIDTDGMILKRFFQFSVEIGEEVNRWVRRMPSNGDAGVHGSVEQPRGPKANVFSGTSYTYTYIADSDLKSAVRVYFLGTCGFMISGGGKTILVDALYRHPRIDIVRTPDDVFTKMLNRESPFQHVELILVSHNHSDHFTTNVAYPFLTKHQETRMVANKHTIALAREQDPEMFEKVKHQIVNLTPEWGTLHEEAVNGVPLKTYLVSHSPQSRPEEREYSVSHFLLDLEGLKFLHMGDIYHEANIEYFRQFGLQNEHIDVVFAETWDYEAGKTVMNDFIKPKLYVVMHNRFGDDKLYQRMLKTFQHTIGFTKPMERKIFIKN